MLRVVVSHEHVEVASVELDVLRRLASAVDHGGQDALATQVADLLADDLAGLGRHDRTGAH